MKQVVICILLSIIFAVDSANFVSRTLGEHMVLQRAPEQAKLWGWTKTAGIPVTVTFDGRNFTANSNAQLLWTIQLPATAAGGPHKITITGDGNTVNWVDIYFGDVWLCSGQSNMQWDVQNSNNATNEIRDADNFPLVRIFTVGQGTASKDPLLDLNTVAQPWSVASSRSIGGFSAVCWFFGKELTKTLHVPMGLVSTNWGGTRVEQWSSKDVFTTCPFGPVDIRSNLYNAMINPYLNMRVKGATWYQGESNVGEHTQYACLFQNMIKDWRLKFNQNYAFYFVQLAPWSRTADGLIAEMRLVQEQTVSHVPLTGMATAVDLGQVGGDIHPKNKQDVGFRLSRLALNTSYGINVISTGPNAVSASVIDTNPAKVQIYFQKNINLNGLKFKYNTCGLNNVRECAWFEALTTTNQWINGSSIVVVADHVEVTFPFTGKPQRVRYGYGNWPVASVYNADNIATPPFVFIVP